MCIYDLLYNTDTYILYTSVQNRYYIFVAAEGKLFQ